MEGRLDNVYFKSSDVITEHIYKARRDGKTKTIKNRLFKGRLYIFDLTKQSTVGDGATKKQPQRQKSLSSLRYGIDGF